MAWAYANPAEASAVLDRALDPEGPEYGTQLEVVTSLADRGRRIVAATALGEAVGIGCCPDPDAEMVDGDIGLIVITTNPLTAQVVDEDGQLLEELSGWTSAEWNIYLRRTDDGEWRVRSIQRAEGTQHGD
jgi:hypothetical protein